MIKCEIQLGIVGVLVLFNAERFDEMRYRGDVQREEDWSEDRSLRDAVVAGGRR